MSTKKTGVDQQLIRDLAGILDETNLTEIEVEQGDLRVRVSRQSPAVHTVAAPVRQPAIAQVPIPAAPGRPPASAAVDISKNAVTSPMVGTAYMSPSPEAEPFIDGRPAGARRPDAADHRSHEDDEPDPVAAAGNGDGDPVRGWPARRIWRAAGRHRIGTERAACSRKS